MPGKKKKYNARFPPARIKKIMQSDEEVGKVAAAVPVIISRALELFVQSLLTKAGEITTQRHAKTLTPYHLKQCIASEQRFDFLQEIFASVTNIGADGDSETETFTTIPLSTPDDISLHQSNPLESISTSTSTKPNHDSPSRGRGRGRGRGKPRKMISNNDTSTRIKRPRGRPRKSSFREPVIENVADDLLEVDLPSSDSDLSEEENSPEIKDKSYIDTLNSIDSNSVLDSLPLQTSTKSLNNSLLGGIQITIPQVPAKSFTCPPNDGPLVTYPTVTNGTGGIPVPVITSSVDISKQSTPPCLSSQIDEDYDC